MNDMAAKHAPELDGITVDAGPADELRDVGEVRRMCNHIEMDLDQLHNRFEQLTDALDPVLVPDRAVPNSGDTDPTREPETAVGTTLARSSTRIRLMSGWIDNLLTQLEV